MEQQQQHQQWGSRAGGNKVPKNIRQRRKRLDCCWLVVAVECWVHRGLKKIMWLSNESSNAGRRTSSTASQWRVIAILFGNPRWVYGGWRFMIVGPIHKLRRAFWGAAVSDRSLGSYKVTRRGVQDVQELVCVIYRQHRSREAFGCFWCSCYFPGISSNWNNLHECPAELDELLLVWCFPVWFRVGMWCLFVAC